MVSKLDKGLEGPQLKKPEDLISPGVKAFLKRREGEIQVTEAVLRKRPGVLREEDIVKYMSLERVDLEAEKAVMMNRRQNGEFNEGTNEGVIGLRMYLTDAGKNRILKCVQENGLRISVSDFEEIGTGVWELSLQRGTFILRPDCILMHRDCRTAHSVGFGVEYFDSFVLDPRMVIRIEGNGGHLWQNAAYNWDLSVKTTTNQTQS